MILALGTLMIGLALILFFRSQRVHLFTWLPPPNAEMDQFFRSLGKWMTDRAGENFLRNLSARLERAGISPSKAPALLGRSLAFGGAGAICGTCIALRTGNWILAPALLACGLLWPSMQLNSRIRRRQREIFLALPSYLDLLTLALEAGVDLVAALDEITERDSPHPLREEIGLALGSIRMGTPRGAAFQDMARRSGIDALELWASSVVQAEQLGSSLGQILRLQAESLRREIYRQAEERAQRAPLKMLLPLIGLIFPVVFLLLFAPIALRMLF